MKWKERDLKEKQLSTENKAWIDDVIHEYATRPSPTVCIGEPEYNEHGELVRGHVVDDLSFLRVIEGLETREEVGSAYQEGLLEELVSFYETGHLYVVLETDRMRFTGGILEAL